MASYRGACQTTRRGLADTPPPAPETAPDLDSARGPRERRDATPPRTTSPGLRAGRRAPGCARLAWRTRATGPRADSREACGTCRCRGRGLPWLLPERRRRHRLLIGVHLRQHRLPPRGAPGEDLLDGAGVVVAGIGARWVASVLHRRDRLEQQPARGDDGAISRAQVFLRAIDDRPH